MIISGIKRFIQRNERAFFTDGSFICHVRKPWLYKMLQFCINITYQCLCNITTDFYRIIAMLRREKSTWACWVKFDFKIYRNKMILFLKNCPVYIRENIRRNLEWGKNNLSQRNCSPLIVWDNLFTFINMVDANFQESNSQRLPCLMFSTIMK